MSKKKSTLVLNVVVLFLVTFVSVLLLAVVNQVTMDPIAQAELDARNATYKEVFSEAQDFADVDNFEALVEDFSATSDSTCTIDDAHVTLDGSGNTLGYVIAATSKEGYGGDVQIAVGITADGTLTGFSVIKHSETAGLGAKAAEPEFASQFAGKKAEMLAYTKTGAAAANEIDAISGATITTNAVTNATNTAIAFFNNYLKGE